MSCDCLCYVISAFLAVPWFGLQCVIEVFPDYTHYFVFDQALHQATRLENLVQLSNAESHAIGIKPVHGIDDAIAKYITFLTNLSKEMDNNYVYVPDNIDQERLIQFSCDNIALLKATVDSKLFTLHCTEMIA